LSKLAPDRIRVMTWNIHGALGRNPRFDLDRVVALVRRHAPDIIALQEIDSRRAREAGTGNPFDVLQQALGAYGIGAKTVTTADGDYGQALISRWPLANTEIHDLSWPEREPRRAICTDVLTPAGPLRVVATHLGLTFRERRSQAITLLKALGSLRVPTVALGDFNDWFWAGSVRRRLARALPACSRHRTFPSAWPLFQLDRVFLWPPQALLGSHTDSEARSISDHLPVFADIDSAIVAAAQQSLRNQAVHLSPA
jgi:endonuclease/exonuclease/phosphatase family metal-dependent hydrolase